MASHVHLLDRIKHLMDAGGIDPTPANYEFWYRYATAADPALVEAVDAVRRTVGRVSPRAMENIRRELFGGRTEAELSSLLAKTQTQLQRMEGYVEGADADARDYSRTLQEGRAGMADADDAGTGQRELLAEMINATSAMIDKTATLEKRLEESGAEISTLKKDLKSAQSESRTDALTSLPNRKAFMAYLEAQSARVTADRKPLCLAFCDIDHFKKFNDTWGHRLGDEVLRLVGQSLTKLCHGVGYPARYGGEEFVIVMPGKSLEAAHDISEQVRDFIASRTVRAKGTGKEVGRITLSLGIAQLSPRDSLDELIERADAALYLAKERGRNRICLETDLGVKAA